MKTDRKKLVESLRIANKLLEHRNTLPILSCVRIDPKSGSIIATNLESFLYQKVPWEVASSEAVAPFCVQGKKLAEIVGALPPEVETVEMECRGSTHQTTTKTPTISSIAIHGTVLTGGILPAEEFPDVPQVDSLKALPLKIEGFTETIRAVVSAAGENDARYILNGILIDPREGVAVGTDGHRLHIRQFKKQAAPRFIIPADAASLSLQIGPSEIGLITLEIKADVPSEKGKNKKEVVRVETTQVLFQYPDKTLLVRPIEGNYPNYNQVIPKEFKHRYLVGVQDLRGKILQAIPVAKAVDKTGAAGILRFHKDGVTVRALHADFGRFSGSVPKATPVVPSDQVVTIGFNLKYLLDALDGVPSDCAVIQFSDPHSPAQITAADQATAFTGIVMPLRVNTREEDFTEAA